MKFLFSCAKGLLILGILMVCSCCGTCPEDKSWETVSFPIMTWIGPSINDNVEDNLQGVVDAGFTVNYSGGTRESNLKALDTAENLGLKLLIRDQRIRPDKPVDLSALLTVDSVIADYKDHPALFGYYLRDEPSARHFKNLSVIQRYFNAIDSEHMAYINLFPNYANEEQLGVPTYEEHVSKYMDTVKPRVLSYDHYCITRSGLREGYYENLEIIRKYALQYDVPFWAFTLSTEHYNYPLPTEGHIRFQLFSDLAYGAKGLQYFTYGRVKSDKFFTALLDSLGNKTPTWYIAQTVNREILQLAPVLKILQSVNVYHSEPLPKGTRGIPEDFLISSVEGEPLVIGYMEDPNGIPYVMLVHRNYQDFGDVVVTVSDAVKGLVEISRANGIELTQLKPDSNRITLHFKAGAGRLFRVECN